MNIKYAFQDEIHLYLVTEFMKGGDIFFHLHEKGRFKRDRAKFYKPENILMYI